MEAMFYSIGIDGYIALGFSFLANYELYLLQGSPVTIAKYHAHQLPGIPDLYHINLFHTLNITLIVIHLNPKLVCMDIKLDFNSEEVAAAIKQALLGTAFEKLFRDAIQKSLDELSKSTGWGTFTREIDAMIKQHMMNTARELLLAEHGEAIREIIKTKLQETKLDEFASTFVDKIKFNTSY
jgi:hypothetical protein